MFRVYSRNFSKYIDRDKTSKAIRQRFFDYFINKHNHNFIKSSPVVPFCDPSVAFVNAGMNQFKGIFLGTQEAPCKKAANSQKCIRVGGKHNDLMSVGSDGYHHTFFEMLGNWSFGDYYKKEACQLAWDFLTKEYQIPANQLYVTYFSGCQELGLDADLDTKEIWLEIGIKDDRILPFGMKENFWEMGLTGPCGPCTEIHIDHITTINRSNLVNKGLFDLTELWNLVFIEYNRNENGVVALPKKHVDTGMGFERLTAILQDRISNYDTDIFSYLFKAIQKNCSSLPPYEGKFGENDWNNIDTAYRILADHARMITVCLSDGMIPEENQKLRRVLRRAFLISENTFKNDRSLIKELSNYVIENLGPVYCEMERNVKQIQQIIDYEGEVYSDIRKSAFEEWQKFAKSNEKLFNIDVIESPGIVAGYKELKANQPKEITDEIAFHLYDTHGLDEDAIFKLAHVFNLDFNPIGLQNKLESAKQRTKATQYLTNNVIFDQLRLTNIPKTKTDLYSYKKDQNKYIFHNLKVRVLKIIENLDLLTQVHSETYCSLVLDQTNLYTEAGGQISDQGTIVINDNVFEVTETQNCNGFILHKGYFHGEKNSKLEIGQTGVIFINPEFRLAVMQNHTGVHLLNAILKEVKKATCQKSSSVTDKYLNLDVGIFGDKLSIEDVQQIEKRINRIIEEKVEVLVKNSQKLMEESGVTLIPGEIYPENDIRLVAIKSHQGFVSKEPCCGTHVVNTGDLADFCIIGCKSLGRSTSSIWAVTGKRAKMARDNSVEIMDGIEEFDKSIRDNIDKPVMLNNVIISFKQRLNFDYNSSDILPFTVKHKCQQILADISKQIKASSKGALKEFIDIEMKNALESNVSTTKSNQKYMIHYLRSSIMLENAPLNKATKLCPDIPILVISYSDNMVKARSCVPKQLNKAFSAEKWLRESVASVFRSNTAPPKGQDGTLICNMKAKRVSIEDWDPLLEESLKAAKKYIEERL